MIRTIKKSSEREVTCPRCNSVIGYMLEDVRIATDLASDSYYAITCPECNKEILLNI